MIFIKTKIEGLYIIEPELKVDERGFSARVFCKNELEKQGLVFDMAQANKSFTNKKGIIRGMHFQNPPKAEIKIVQCLNGAVYSVAVDLRKCSPTYGKWVGQELTEDNGKMFFISEGFAHGYQSLKNNSKILYFVSEFYSSKYESGVRWDDPFFNIKWPIKNPILSEKDKNWPLIKSK